MLCCDDHPCELVLHLLPSNPSGQLLRQESFERVITITITQWGICIAPLTELDSGAEQ